MLIVQGIEDCIGAILFSIFFLVISECSHHKNAQFLQDKLPVTHRYVYFSQVLKRVHVVGYTSWVTRRGLHVVGYTSWVTRRGLHVCEVVYLFYFSNKLIARGSNKLICCGATLNVIWGNLEHCSKLPHAGKVSQHTATADVTGQAYCLDYH